MALQALTDEEFAAQVCADELVAPTQESMALGLAEHVLTGLAKDKFLFQMARGFNLINEYPAQGSAPGCHTRGVL